MEGSLKSRPQLGFSQDLSPAQPGEGEGDWEPRPGRPSSNGYEQGMGYPDQCQPYTDFTFSCGPRDPPGGDNSLCACGETEALRVMWPLLDPASMVQIWLGPHLGWEKAGPVC